MIVVKVGGSLFDSPALGPALRAYLNALAPRPVLLVAGGGAVADAVRAFDRTHALGEAPAHWLALASLDVTRRLLEAFCGADWLFAEVSGSARPTPPAPLPEGRGEKELRVSCALPSPEGSSSSSAARRLSPLPQGRGAGGGGRTTDAAHQPLSVLNCLAFAREDEARPGALPHTWAVTTDSIAARAAEVFGATRLVLLKSVDVPPGISHEEAALSGFVDAHFPLVAARLNCPIEFRNFRHELAAHA